MTIGDIIKSRRKELNLRQEDLAELVETTKATVSRWESGDIHKMKRPMIAKLAKALQIDPMIFLQGRGPNAGRRAPCYSLSSCE